MNLEGRFESAFLLLSTNHERLSNSMIYQSMHAFTAIFFDGEGAISIDSPALLSKLSV